MHITLDTMGKEIKAGSFNRREIRQHRYFAKASTAEMPCRPEASAKSIRNQPPVQPIPMHLLPRDPIPLEQLRRSSSYTVTGNSPAGPTHAIGKCAKYVLAREEGQIIHYKARFYNSLPALDRPPVQVDQNLQSPVATTSKLACLYYRQRGKNGMQIVYKTELYLSLIHI